MDKPLDIPSNPFIIRDIRELSAIPALPKVDSKPFFDIPINFSAIEQENADDLEESIFSLEPIINCIKAEKNLYAFMLLFVSVISEFEEYQFLSHLANGQYGEIFRAYNTVTKITCVIKEYNKSKVLKHSKSDNPLLELYISHELDGHPNIIHFFTVLNCERFFYGVFENGIKTLLDYNDAPYPIKLEIFKRFMLGVDYMHGKGYCHRDISIENIVIILEEATKKPIPKIIDFGVTWRIEDGNVLKDDIKGKMSYIPPEAYRCDSMGYNPIAGDIWSCGIVLYQFMLGITPFPSAAVGDAGYEEFASTYATRQLITGYSMDPFLVDLMYKMLNPSPLDRPTAHQVLMHDCLKNIIVE